VAVGTDVGYYTLPVILSFDGVEKTVNSKLGKAFGDVGKRSSKAFADGTEVDLKRATDAYGKLRDRAADALGKVRVEEEKLNKARAGGKSDQIAAAEERLSKARRDSTRINREAIASYGELESAQKRLADSTGGLLSKLKNVGGAASSSGGQAASGFVDGFGGPIAALGSKAGPVGIALAATAGLGLLAGKALGDQILAGLDQLQGQANVAAKLGLTPEQLKPIARAAADAYAQNFGDSVQGNLDAARAAIQGGLIDPNATQADIEKVVAQLNTVAAVTGESIPNAVRTAQQAVRTGLAQDVTGAFDLIVKAQQSGLNVSEDLFDTLNEYGTQFRKLGLDGPEALGLIAQAVQGGARDTDTAADALKEFSIRSIDGSKLTGQAYKDLGLSFKGTTEAFAAGGETAKATFQEVVNRIAAVEDPAKRAQIQVALFGTKAEDLGDAVNAMNLNTAVAQLGEVQGATEQAANTLGGTGASSVESARRNIEVAVDNLQQGLAQAFGPALQKVADWVVANQDKIVGFFTTLGHAAISASEFIVYSVGDILSTIGQIVQPFGDIQGFMLKFQAFQADVRGDTETAEQLRKQAEEAFGFGEGLTAAGEAMKDFDASSLHKALDDTASKAANATTATSGLTSSLDQLRKQQFFEAFGKPVPGGSLAGIGAPSTRTGSNAGLTQASLNAKAAIEAQFPEIATIGGYRPDPKYPNEHPAGKALDVMIPDWNKPSGKAYGDKVAKYLLENASALGIDYILWQQRQWNADGTSSPMQDLKNPRENHMDHVHVHTEGSPQLPGARPPARPTPSTTSLPGSSATSLPGSSVMPAAISATPGLSSAIDTSRLTAGSQALTNAYGPGYEAGIGTPGRNEYGDIGYFRTDERALREAQQRADDAAYAITEAEAATQAARDARAALDDTPNVDASQIAGADDAVRDAERRAALARREAADAATDAAEVAKGEFTKAKEVAKEPKKASRDSGLGALGSIASSFLEETFGFGSLLPALDSFMPLQMADTLIGSALGFAGGAQDPMSADLLTSSGTSGAAFGIPDIAAPPMPQGSAHTGGGGAPGPTIVNVDQSQNFSNSPLGWDPVEVNKERDRNINRAPRLPIGMGN
jgi:phage-related minor tail protein